MPKIEEQIDGMDEIIEINRKHYETGVFYMPKEYFEGWFRNICICKPNYKKNFPKIYNTLNIYKAISKYYKLDSGKFFFETTQGKELIKTDITSKENLKNLKKIIHHINSNFIYVYDKQLLSTIWSSGKNNFESSNNYYFVNDNNSFNVKLKKKNEISENDFKYGNVYSPLITTYYMGKSQFKKYEFILIILTLIKSLEEIKNKNLWISNNSDLFMNQLTNDLKFME